MEDKRENITAEEFKKRNKAEENSKYILNKKKRKTIWNELGKVYSVMISITTLVILIIFGFMLFQKYNSNYPDPIAEIKSTFIKWHLIFIGISIVMAGMMHLFAKDKKALLNGMLVTFLFSMVSMLIFTGIKVEFDTRYNESWFTNYYNEEYDNKTGKTEIKFSLSMTDIGFAEKTEKEMYVSECKNLYNVFVIKSFATIAIHLVLNILILYQVAKLLDINNKKNKLLKDDIIIFDEEENVKF